MFRTKSVFCFAGVLLFATPLNAAEDEVSRMKVIVLKAIARGLEGEGFRANRALVFFSNGK